MALLETAEVGEEHSFYFVDLAAMARPDMLDAVAFHGEPIVAGCHVACQAPDELLLTIRGPKQVFTIFDISLDIMTPWLPIDFNFDVHVLFKIYAVGRHTTELYA